MKKLKLFALLAAAALFFSCSQPASSSSDKKDDKPETPVTPESPNDPSDRNSSNGNNQGTKSGDFSFDPTINQPDLPNCDKDTILAGNTYYVSGEQQFTITFGTDGTYTTSYLTFDHNVPIKKMISKYNYSYDANNKILYSVAHSSNEISNSEELVTFEQFCNLLNNISYDAFAAEPGFKYTREEFKSLLQETYTRGKKAFETLGVLKCWIESESLHEYVLYTEGSSILNTSMNFKLASISGSAVNKDDIESYTNINSSSTINGTIYFGRLCIPFINKDNSENSFNDFYIMEITSNTITVKPGDPNSTESYTLSYTETLDSSTGIVTLSFTGIKDISNTAEASRKNCSIPDFTLSSDVESVYEKLQVKS